MGTPSHLGHMDRVAATMPSQAHAGAAQEAPDIGQWEGQEVPLVRPSSCTVKGGIPSSRRYLPTYLLIPLLLTRCRLRLLSVRFLSFGALLGTCKSQNPISVNWKEMNTIRMHRIKRALLQNFAWLPFAVAPHPLAFDTLPPPPSFCPPPLVRCAPGEMQKTKSDLRQLEKNEHDTYAQNRESGTAAICMVTFCCCPSSTCF